VILWRYHVFIRDNLRRWDTPQHVLIDDPPQIWPGKDYSNGRVSDFFNLNKPEEDMYDRSKIPRMPWHDVGLQVVGQPARDLARHFIQRWNYLLRIKNHTRTMPFLLPPPEFKPGELTQMGLTGTCEMQICRSAGPWSMGLPSRIEHSIQNAYLKGFLILLLIICTSDVSRKPYRCLNTLSTSKISSSSPRRSQMMSRLKIKLAMPSSIESFGPTAMVLPGSAA
jgi:phosphatidylserine/phosphatidylglycerophosphate/cardiolipin synthase-like enzyme